MSVRTLPVSTETARFTGLSVTPKTDRDGVQRIDPQGRALSTVQCVYLNGDQADIFKVTVIEERVAAFEAGDEIDLVGLEAGCYPSDGRAHFYFSATRVTRTANLLSDLEDGE